MVNKLKKDKNMSMFEDIENTLKNGRLPKKDDDDEGTKDNNRPRRRNRPTEDEIAKVLQDKFGRKAIGVPGGIIMDSSEEDVHKPIYDKIENLMKSMAYIAEKAGVPPTCLDANKVELAEGDVLKCPGDEIKTVLKVGWKFAILSRTDDQTKVDGPWFEDEINNLNFIKKI